MPGGEPRGTGILVERLALIFEWYRGMVDERTGRLLYLALVRPLRTAHRRAQWLRDRRTWRGTLLDRPQRFSGPRPGPLRPA